MSEERDKKILLSQRIILGDYTWVKAQVDAGLKVTSALVIFAKGMKRPEIAEMLEAARQAQMEKMAEKGAERPGSAIDREMIREMNAVMISHIRRIIPDDASKSQSGKKKQRH